MNSTSSAKPKILERDAMTRGHRAIRFILTVGTAAFAELRRLLKRLTAPGAGPYVAGC